MRTQIFYFFSLEGKEGKEEKNLTIGNIIKELEEFIKLKAKEHQESDPNNDSPYEYEMIEQDTFEEMMRFFINEGVKPEGIDYDIFFNGIDYDAEDVDEEFDRSYYYTKLLEIIDEMNEKKELPENVEYIYNFYLETFWPGSTAD